jgi:hypothetical protein
MWATQPTQRVSILRVANTPLNRGTLRGKCLALQAYIVSERSTNWRRVVIQYRAPPFGSNRRGGLRPEGCI